MIGAGPTGLACAIEAQRAGLRVVSVDKGCVCNSLFHYPSHMTFFTTSELLEIGDIPFPSPNAKPTRNEALEYYRQVAAFYKLDVRQYQLVERVEGADGILHGSYRRPLRPAKTGFTARKLAIATGYYDLPNYLNIPGEDLSKVHHYYDDPHPYFGTDVVVIGGKNSAAIAALELWRHGARVTLVHRGAGDPPPREVLDQAGHREPHQERRDPGPLQHQRGRDHAGHRGRRDALAAAKFCATTSSSR